MELIDEVIVGEICSPQLQSQLMTLCKGNYPKLPLLPLWSCMASKLLLVSDSMKVTILFTFHFVCRCSGVEMMS